MQVARSAGSGRYTGVAIALHWLVAAGIAVNLVLVWTVGSLPGLPTRSAIDLHKSIGLTVLGLALMRLLWRWSHPPPVHDPALPALERRTAHGVHWLLYGLIFALPVSGYIHDSAWRGAETHPILLYGLVPFPRIGPIEHLPVASRDWVHTVFFAVHGYAAWVLYGLVALHVAGALKHQLLDRQPELQRMGWPGRQVAVRDGSARTGTGT